MTTTGSSVVNQQPLINQQRWARLLTAALVALTATGCSLQRVIDAPVFVSGGTTTRAATHCRAEFEGVPCAIVSESSEEPQPSVGWAAAFGTDRVSFAEGDWSNWQAGGDDLLSGFKVPVNPDDPAGLLRLSGDAWMTYSKAKNLIFAYFIGRVTDRSCVAVAATSPESLASEIWDFPAVCIVDERGDQCAIHHADSSNTFYSACKLDGIIRIDAFANCETAPGAAYGCPRTFRREHRRPGLQALQFDLVDNPCSGNLLMTYRAQNEVRLAVYSSSLRTLRSDHLIRESQPSRPGLVNSGCCNGTIRRCGMGTSDCRRAVNCGVKPGDQCLRVNARPSIDLHFDPSPRNGDQPTCLATVAYDSLVTDAQGDAWSKSRLDLLDVSDDATLVSLAKWNSTDAQRAWNHYLSYAVMSDRGPGRFPAIGWFWISDVRGACSLVPEGATSINKAETMQATGPLGESFPGVYINSFGIGDYIRGVKGGDRDGSVLLSWGQPVPTGQPCVSCQGTEWNLATKMARIRWKLRSRPGNRSQPGSKGKALSVGPVKQLARDE